MPRHKHQAADKMFDVEKTTTESRTVNYGNKQNKTMSNKERKRIEQKLLNATEVKHHHKVKMMLEAMSDEELSDHYADAMQLAMVYRDNPQIRHLSPCEVMQLPLHKMEIWQKHENGQPELKESKFIVTFQQERSNHESNEMSRV